MATPNKDGDTSPQIGFNLSEEEKEIIRKAAKKVHLTIGVFVRMVALQHSDKILKDANEEEVIRQMRINKLLEEGNNLLKSQKEEE